jgi:hypothetical protein
MTTWLIILDLLTNLVVAGSINKIPLSRLLIAAFDNSFSPTTKQAPLSARS